MSHIEMSFSPDTGEIINQIQLLHNDLEQSRQLFKSSYQNFRNHIQRTESLIVHLMQQLQVPVPQNYAALETLPNSVSTEESSVSTDDEQESKRDPKKPTKLNGMPCPHSDCEGSWKRYTRADNLERHYTKHLPCEEKCEGCEDNIMWQYDRRHHIERCLKPSNHNGLAKASKNWHNALVLARIDLQKSKPRKKQKRAIKTTARPRKASKLDNVTVNVNTEERNQDTLNSPTHSIPRGSHIPHQNQDAPDRAPMSDSYTIEDNLFYMTTNEWLSFIEREQP
ncbi:hypothetical protein FNYG_12764 [Fusarium nygamai]|uniref:Uncharacterized protein n=1 Tax=Gibberella nygamai TaxID=42673 RepID=A0A2K0VV71_GIBNY|nr:hypothetical protein FNYG_12764 [Fusarium nygamai]